LFAAKVTISALSPLVRFAAIPVTPPGICRSLKVRLVLIILLFTVYGTWSVHCPASIKGMYGVNHVVSITKQV
jgi:hypothetical protein